MENYKRLIGVVFFEKFAFNGLRSILILYAVKYLAMDEHGALECIGAALGMGFLTPVLGGALADWICDAKKVIILGLCLTVLSTIMLCRCHGSSNQLFYLCLTLLVLGTGFVRSNVPALLSYYQQTNPDLFTKYYIYINIGTLLGTLSCGLLAEVYGWQLGFLASCMATITALVLAFKIVDPREDIVNFTKISSYSYLKFIVSVTIAFILTYFSIVRLDIFTALNVLISVCILAYLINMVYQTKELNRYHFYKLLTLGATHIIFLALYDQGSYSLILFIDRYVDRSIPDYLAFFNTMKWNLLPVSGFKLIDPFLNAVLGGAIISLWKIFERNGKKINPYYKFILGIIIIFLAFMFLYVSTNENSRMLFVDIFVLELLFVLSELCIIPTAITFVGQIAPPGKKSLLMGFWFMGMGISQWLALNLAKIATTPGTDQAYATISNYKHSFQVFAYMAFGVMIALIVFKSIESIYIKRMQK